MVLNHRLSSLIILLGLSVTVSNIAQAATLTVNSTADTSDCDCDTSYLGGCTIRDALCEADTNGAADTIVLQAGATYSFFNNSWTWSDYDVTTQVEIEGNGAVLQRDYSPGNADFPLLYVSAGGNLYLNDMIITNGSLGAIQVDNGNLVGENLTITENSATYDGGAIRVHQGTMELSDSLISNNTANNSGGAISVNFSNVILQDVTVEKNYSGAMGGGLAAFSESELHISGCTFMGNLSVNLGGGIFLNGSDNYGALVVRIEDSSFIENETQFWGGGMRIGGLVDLEIANSTFSGNISTTRGGGLHFQTIMPGSNVNITNITVVENVAERGAGISIRKCGIVCPNESVAPVITNSLIANNVATTAGIENCETPGVYFESGGHNVLGAPAASSGACTFTSDPTDQYPGTVNISGVLALSNEGFPGGLSHKLDSSCIAVDNGDNAACSAFDQIGESRWGTACEVGAVELVDEPFVTQFKPFDFYSAINCEEDSLRIVNQQAGIPALLQTGATPWAGQIFNGIVNASEKHVGKLWCPVDISAKYFDYGDGQYGVRVWAADRNKGEKQSVRCRMFGSHGVEDLSNFSDWDNLFEWESSDWVSTVGFNADPTDPGKGTTGGWNGNINTDDPDMLDMYLKQVYEFTWFTCELPPNYEKSPSLMLGYSYGRFN